MLNAEASESDELRLHNWHPRLVQLYRYWRSLHHGELLPSRRDFDPAAVSRLLPTMWLVDVLREPMRFRYRLIGTRIRDAGERDVTGSFLDEAHPEIAARDGFARFREIVGSGRPSWRRGRPFLFVHHQDFHEIENLFLPLAGDGKTVDMVLINTVFYRSDGTEA